MNNKIRELEIQHLGPENKCPYCLVYKGQYHGELCPKVNPNLTHEELEKYASEQETDRS